MKNLPFFKQADLMLRLLSYVNEEKSFALHGGTAINFFVRDLPRLSVDIDLTYLPIEPRDETLANITKMLRKMAKRFRGAFPGIQVDEKEDREGNVSKLLVNYENLESVIIIDRNGEVIALKPNSKGNYASYASVVPESLKDLLIRKEDRFFYYNFGINLFVKIKSRFFILEINF